MRTQFIVEPQPYTKNQVNFTTPFHPKIITESSVIENHSLGLHLHQSNKLSIYIYTCSFFSADSSELGKYKTCTFNLRRTSVRFIMECTPAHAPIYWTPEFYAALPFLDSC
ncbi:hypothetical protein QQ045_011600 [Rhodiola kirilowii]